MKTERHLRGSAAVVVEDFGERFVLGCCGVKDGRWRLESLWTLRFTNVPIEVSLPLKVYIPWCYETESPFALKIRDTLPRLDVCIGCRGPCCRGPDRRGTAAASSQTLGI